MEDKWKQKFNEKFSDFELEIPVPPFENLPLKRRSSTAVWLAAISATAAAAVLALVFLAKPSSYESYSLTYSIAEPEPKVRLSIDHPRTMPSCPQRDAYRPHEDISLAGDNEEDAEETTASSNLATETHCAAGQSLGETSIISSMEYLADNEKEEYGRLSISLIGNPYRMATVAEELRGQRGGADVTQRDSLFSFCPPVNMGLSFRLGLTDKWSVESGLEYSFHQVKWQYRVNSIPSSEGYYFQHFLGVPISVSYSFLERGRVSLHGAVGGKASIRLSAKEEIFPEGFNKVMLIRHNESHPFLFSISAAADLDYRIFSNVSIYARPDISLFLNEIPDLPDYQWRHRAVFDFGIGLRLHFNRF